MATTDQSIRSYLDSLGQLPGCILYRNTIAWEALPPGNQGQILTLDAAGLPAWTDRGNYFPAMMQFNGTSQYMTHTGLTVAAGPWTMPIRFRLQAAATNRTITHAHIGSNLVFAVRVETTGKLRIEAANSTATIILKIRSIDRVDNDTPQYAWIKWNAATAALEFKINGQDADDTTWPSRLVNTGTPPSGSIGTFSYARWPNGTMYYPGQIGAFGWKQTDLPNWQDFMDPQGWPHPIDHDTWTQWVGQPPVWHESGALQWNRGSAAPFTPFNNPTIADPLTWN